MSFEIHRDKPILLEHGETVTIVTEENYKKHLWKKGKVIYPPVEGKVEIRSGCSGPSVMVNGRSLCPVDEDSVDDDVGIARVWGEMTATSKNSSHHLVTTEKIIPK